MTTEASSMLLIGIGGAGTMVAHGISRAFGNSLRFVTADTDAASGDGGQPFVLLGGDRLSGRGSGGDVVSARHAAEESVNLLDEELSGVRLAVIVTGLGGGTGGGATLETVKHLTGRGIPSVVFATLPFSFEGDERRRSARSMMTMIEENANASFFMKLDDLVGDTDNMNDALRRAIDTLATGITLFWRLVEKPGYIRLDAERLRAILSRAGRGRFATVCTQGADRARDAADTLARTATLTNGAGPVRSIVCGVLAGDDLRLSEIGTIAAGVRKTFGDRAAFELATVNDEETFAGRLSVVLLLFESSAGDAETETRGARHGKGARSALGNGPGTHGRFANAEPTMWNGEDLDVPTFLRQNITLEF